MECVKRTEIRVFSLFWSHLGAILRKKKREFFEIYLIEDRHPFVPSKTSKELNIVEHQLSYI